MERRLIDTGGVAHTLYTRAKLFSILSVQNVSISDITGNALDYKLNRMSDLRQMTVSCTLFDRTSAVTYNLPAI